MAYVTERPKPAEAGWFRTEQNGDTFRLIVGGRWVISEARRLDPLMKTIDPNGHTRVEVDCSTLEQLDTVGAWLLLRTKRALEHRGVKVQPINVREEYHALVHTIDHDCTAPPVEMPPPHTFADRLERIGRGLVRALHQAYELVGFFGLVASETVTIILKPRRMRVAALFRQIEIT